MLASARKNAKKKESCEKDDEDSMVKLDPDTAKYIEEKKNSKHF